MLFVIIFFSVVMVLDCIILVFLVLMQLPKKEAGAGLAFGGAATDALFGAGSGNFLTKATKYCAVIFFALAILLSFMETRQANSPGSEFMEKVKQHQSDQPLLAPAPVHNAAASTTNIVNTNLLSTPPSQSQTAPIEATTNAAPAPAGTNK